MEQKFDNDLMKRKIEALMYTVSGSKTLFAKDAKYSKSYVFAQLTRCSFHKENGISRSALTIASRIYNAAIENGRIRAVSRLTGAHPKPYQEFRRALLEWLMSPKEFERSETTFASRLDTALKTISWRNLDLADTVGLPRETVCRFRKGNREPSMYTAETEKIATAIFEQAEKTYMVNELMAITDFDYMESSFDHENFIKWMINII